MTEINVISTLISQAPGLGGVIVVVWFFLRAIEKRDALFVGQMSQITERLAAMETLLVSHDKWEREVVGDIKVATRQPRKVKS